FTGRVVEPALWSFQGIVPEGHTSIDGVPEGYLEVPKVNEEGGSKLGIPGVELQSLVLITSGVFEVLSESCLAEVDLEVCEELVLAHSMVPTYGCANTSEPSLYLSRESIKRPGFCFASPVVTSGC